MDAIPKADGSIIIDTKLQTDGFSKGVGNLKTQFGGLMSGLKKIGALAAAAFSVRAIVNFGKEAVAIGSDLQEVQNVVDVTFGELSGVVNDFAESALESFGLSELAAKQYTSTIGAMLKSMGFVPAQAAEMSMELAGLAGDMASFYNLSGDEAFQKIRAGISGETEPLKQLGINLSVANLEQFALTQGMRKSYDEMTQQEQALLRYNYLLSVTADAQGDFSRTSDSWANQTRILAERFNQLKGTIGQGLINALTPVIRTINTLLAGLQRLASAFQQFTALLFGKSGGTQSQLSGIADGYKAAAGGAESLEKATKGAGKAAKKALAGFDEIQKLGNESSGGGGGGVGSAGGVNLPVFSLTGEVQENISPQIEHLAEKIKELIEPLQNISFTPLKNSLSGLGSEFAKLGRVITDSLEWVWFNILVPLSEWSIEDLAPHTVDVLSESISFLSAAAAPVSDGLRELVEDLRPVFQFIGDTVLVVIDKWKDLFTKLAAVFEEKGPKITDTFSTVGDTIATVWEFAGPIFERMRDSWGETADFMSSALADLISLSIDLMHIIATVGNEIAKFVSSVFAKMDGLKNSIAKVSDWLQNIFQRDWTELFGTKLGEKLNVFSAVLSGVCKTITDELTGVVEFIAGVFTGDWERAWEGVKTIFKGIVNGIIGMVNGLVRAVVNGVNSVIRALNKISVSIPSWVPGYGGKKFGLNLSTISAPQIPYLAQGAVIPPNAPFMAVLGDQRHGTNIEAPLSTIQEAVALVMEDYAAANLAGHEATVVVLQEILEAVLGIEIGDEMLSNAANRYSTKLAIMRGDV